MATRVECVPDGDGGLTFWLRHVETGNASHVPLAHGDALAVCSSILRAAGVTSAVFDGTRLYEQ